MPKTSNPYRLGGDFLPSAYAIHLEPDLERFTFRGTVTIELEAVRKFSKIRLHALELKIPKAALVRGKERHEAKAIRFDAKYETVELDFGRAFPAARCCNLELEFEGSLNDKMHGFYRTSYDLNGQKTFGAATQFEATDARRAFPCFDEPDRKARFRVALTVPDKLTALSNMPVEAEARSGGKKTIQYETSPIMSTYLVCFVVAHLECIEGKDKNGVPIRIFTTPGKKEQGRFALEVAEHALPYFSEWFGIPYHLPKLDQVALPDFASGAMENWGLVTYRETALLVDPQNSSVAARQRVAEVIAHELAHQWFGNLVTMEWWTDLWLNEGFASYMGPKAVHDQFPEWQIWTQFLVSDFFLALRDDGLKNSHPIEIEVKNPHEIREIFDHITYSKGSSVNRMLEHFLTEPVFRKGLRVYLKKFASKNAKTTDLWAELERASKKPVRAMMASFTKQEGYPVLDVRVKSQSAKRAVLEISQERFLSDGTKDRTGKMWKAPITADAPGAKRVSAVLASRRLLLAVAAPASSWIKINPGQSAFYRVAYSPDLLARLTRALGSGELGIADALGLVDDAFVLARAGRLRTRQALEIAAACKKRVDYNLWANVSGILAEVENILPAPSKEPYAVFARGLYHEVSRRLGWSAAKSDSHLDVLLRSLVIARLGHYGDAAVIGESKNRFARHLASGDLDPNLRGAIYSIVAEHGGADEYDSLLKLYREAPLQEEKVRLLRALTRFREPAVAQKALSFALSPDVRSQDAYVVLAGFGSNAAAREIAWRFIQKPWPALAERFGGGNVGLLGRVIEGSTSGFTAPKQLASVKNFFKTHRVPGTERAVKQSIEVIQLHVDWAARDVADVQDWLKHGSPELNKWRKP